MMLQPELCSPSWISPGRWIYLGKTGVPRLGSIFARQRQEQAGGTEDTPSPGVLALVPLPVLGLFLDFLKLFSALPPAVLRLPRVNPTLTNPQLSFRRY